MLTIEIEVSEQLAQQLSPYREELPALLEAGLRARKRKAHIQSPDPTQIRKILLASGKVLVPDPQYASSTYVRHTPVTISGQSVSEIVLEQRNPNTK